MTERTTYKTTFDWLLNDKYRIAFHVFFWMIMFLDELLSFIGITEPLLLGYWELVRIFLAMMIVYFNLYFLVPVFLLKNRWREYILFTIITIQIYVLIDFMMTYSTIWREHLEEASYTPFSFILSDASWLATTLGTAVGINIFKRFLKNQKRIKKLEKTNIETELAYLKEQINPHFLFNALNNIYVQTRKRPTEASESVLTLSDLLRYQLYDCAKDKVSLQNEVNYLKNYLAIDRMRKDEESLQFEVRGDVKGVEVAPFIFIPFIENAVKHGVTIDKPPYIHILLDIQEEQIIFEVKNSKPAKKIEHASGGIGMGNVKRRLNLLYPESHNLIIQDRQDFYKVRLVLDRNPSLI